MPFTIDHLDHLVLTVADIGVTIDFYTSALGIELAGGCAETAGCAVERAGSGGRVALPKVTADTSARRG